MSGLPAAAHLGLGLALAAPLVYAAGSKLLDPSRFVQALPRYGLAFVSERPITARLLGLVELGAGAALLAVPFAASAVTAGLLYVAFALLLVRARRAGASGDCGCFGVLGGRIDGQAILRNIVLCLACFGLAYARSQGQFVVYDVRDAVAVVVVLTLACVAADTILEIRQRAA